MQFIDLVTQQKRIRKEIEDRIQAILDHGRYIMGPEIGELENRLGSYAGVKHVVGCSSGTDALLMALMAYDIKAGDVVFTTPFTFIATAEVISLLGATPVFVDIDPKTYNLDSAKLETAIQAVLKQDAGIYPIPKPVKEGRLRPRCVIGVDLFGLPADYDRINAVAEKENLFVVEDAAQSFGAEYKGKKSCALAEIGCTSFFPAKPLGCYGDGGAVFTDDQGIWERLVSLRVHGQGTNKYDNVRIGINGRLDSFQAAILLSKLNIFAEEVALRQKVAENYSRLLGKAEHLVLPHIPDDSASVWAQYSIMAENSQQRKAIQDKLASEKIPTAIYYPIPLHLQPAFTDLGYRTGQMPVSEDCADRIFSIPMHPYLSIEQQEMIADAILSA